MTRTPQKATDWLNYSATCPCGPVVNQWTNSAMEQMVPSLSLVAQWSMLGDTATLVFVESPVSAGYASNNRCDHLGSTRFDVQIFEHIDRYLGNCGIQ